MNLEQIQHIINQITEDTLYLKTQETVDAATLNRLRESAFVYAELVRDFNRRIEFVQELLQQGQDTQARKAAEEEPDLRETYRVLQFKELPGWLQIVEDLQLTTPPFLDDEAEMILNDAYQINQAVSQLLLLQHRLVLKNAPLRSRLAVLHRLMVLDRDNAPLWRRDIQTLEAARREELAEDIDLATREKNLRELRTIKAELESDDWLQKPSQRLLLEMNHRIEPLVQMAVLGKISELLPEIQNAFESNDSVRAIQLYEMIQQYRHQAGLTPEESGQETLAPIEAWLGDVAAEKRDTQAWREQCHALKKDIQDRMPRSVIEKQVVELQSRPQGLPPELIAAINIYLQELDAKAVRNKWLRIIGIAASILIIGVVCGLWVWSYRQDQAIQSACAQVRTLIQNDQWEDAESFFSQLRQQNPAIWESPEMRKIFTDFDREYSLRKDADQQRIRNLNTHLTRLTRLKGAGELDSKEAQAALSNVQRLARTAAEKNRLKTWEDQILKINRTVNEKRIQANAQFMETYRRRNSALFKAIMDFQGVDFNDPDAFEKKKKQCREALAEVQGIEPVTYWKNYRIELSRVQKDEIESAEKKIDAQIAAYEDFTRKNQQRQALLKKIQSQYQDVSDTVSMMETYARDFPDAKESHAFSAAAAKQLNAEALDAWNALMKDWKNPYQAAPRAAAERLVKLADFLDKHPKSAVSREAQALKQYYEIVYQAFHDGAKFDPNVTPDPNASLKLIGRKDLNSLFNDATMGALRMVTTKNGKKFFFIHYEPFRIGGQVTSYKIQKIIDPEGNTDRVTVKLDELNSEDDLKREAPIAKLLQRLSKKDRDFKSAQWATHYLELAGMVYEDKTIDPIIKAFMLNRILKEARKVVPDKKVAAVLDDEIKRLSSLGVEQVNWFNREADDTKIVQRKCVIALKKLTDPKTLVKQVQTASQASAQAGGYEPLGVITRDGQTLKIPAKYQATYRLNGQTLQPIRLDEKRQTPDTLPVGVIVLGRPKNAHP